VDALVEGCDVTKDERYLIFNLLKEHFQAFSLVGFDLEGNKVNMADYETPIQGHALAEANRADLNENAQAPEVWVRNLETKPPDTGEEWKQL
jgi:hypothetical protein